MPGVNILTCGQAGHVCLRGIHSEPLLADFTFLNLEQFVPMPSLPKLLPTLPALELVSSLVLGRTSRSDTKLEKGQELTRVLARMVERQ